MRVVSLESFLTDTVVAAGAGDRLVGVSHDSGGEQELEQLPRVTAGRPLGESAAAASTPRGRLEAELSKHVPLIDAIVALNPDVVLTTLRAGGDVEASRRALADSLSGMLGHQVTVAHYNPVRLDDVLDMAESVAEKCGVGARGHDMAQRWKSQMLDWSSNFYERMRHKKVSVISGLAPLRIAGFWISDMVRMCSAVSQVPPATAEHPSIEWEDLVSFQSDVLLIAPQGLSLDDSLRCLAQLENRDEWEQIPAVKRGEVFFTDGVMFHMPGPAIRRAMSILVSAIAGLESGYISDRDSFFRLRWLELHRHRFK